MSWAANALTLALKAPRGTSGSRNAPRFLPFRLWNTELLTLSQRPHDARARRARVLFIKSWSRAKQLVLPVVSKQSIPKMYVLMDGVQVPVVAAETEGRAGRIEGQRARTRECKLGCVFTQTKVDPEGCPIRDPDSTTYVGAIETAEEFGFRIYNGGLAQRLGVGHDQGGPCRRGRLDLESGRPALSRRHSNRGSVSRPAAFMENSGPAPPPRSGGEETLDASHEGPIG